MHKPILNIDFPEFFLGYINNVHEDIPYNLLLENYHNSFLNDIEIIKKKSFNTQYSINKWTISELIRHCIDTERVFSYRALLIARESNPPIRKFDENDFAVSAGKNHIKEDLIEEFISLRNSNRLFFRNLNLADCTKVGTFEDGSKISIKAMAYIIAGHWIHHKKILIERYGVIF